MCSRIHGVAVRSQRFYVARFCVRKGNARRARAVDELHEVLGALRQHDAEFRRFTRRKVRNEFVARSAKMLGEVGFRKNFWTRCIQGPAVRGGSRREPSSQSLEYFASFRRRGIPRGCPNLAL